MAYRINSTHDGSITKCQASKLSQNLKPNCILEEVKRDGTVIDSWHLDYKTFVFFTVEFADYALKNYTKTKIPKAEAAIALTRKWLENTDSVSKEELVAAAEATYDTIAYATALTAYCAIDEDYDLAIDLAHSVARAAATASACHASDNNLPRTFVTMAHERENTRQCEFIVKHLKHLKLC